MFEGMGIWISTTNLQMTLISCYFTTIPDGGGTGYVEVVAQDMRAGEINNKANSAQLSLDLPRAWQRIIILSSG